MQTVKYNLRVKGLKTANGTISVRALIELLQQMTTCAERGLRLAIEGRSVKRGAAPAWIEKSTELVFTGLKSGSTVLAFEAPLLGETMGSMVGQQDFWIKPPAPNDTAFSIISKSVRDTTSENLESDYYDEGVLRSLLDLKHFLKTRAETIELVSPGRKDGFKIDMPVIEKVERLKIKTPDSQAVIISGHLDKIAHSRKKFEISVKDGKSIPGRIDEEYMSVEDLRNLWGKKVTVKGMLHMKPSGNIRLLEAHMLKIMDDSEEIFETVPLIKTESDLYQQHLIPSENKKNWINEVWGKWPEDESIEEIMAEFERKV
ncbi:MAG TPA: hypothetical protein DET40_18050 [Lentisphaeria bacterium]|nr:MAG: hypothetical protein A2X45_01965 [Lentisphaerae bacterium GWF2_50_93]HCE45446.1 hypothetical protein [Lentisphaeria bacterium]